jgi:prolyl oligopeptidase
MRIRLLLPALFAGFSLVACGEPSEDDDNGNGGDDGYAAAQSTASMSDEAETQSASQDTTDEPQTQNGNEPMQSADPYIWLEQVESERALDWAKKHSEETLETLRKRSDFQDLEEAALEVLTSDERIPYGTVRDGFVYNFWQDKANPKGLWRRSRVEAYLNGEPKWETLLDVDALAEAEGTSWVFQGASCAPGGGDRCIVRLSDGGKDAATLREFSLSAKDFVKDGFVSEEAKQYASWVDQDTILIASDWGEGSLTESGYPHTVKRWSLDAPRESASTVFEGEESDVFVFPVVQRSPAGDVVELIQLGETFFEFSTYLVDGDSVEQLPLPRKHDLYGVYEGRLLFKPNQDVSIGGTIAPTGSLAALKLDGATGENPELSVVYEPGPRDAITDVGIAKGRVLIAATENVVGRLYEARRGEAGWSMTGIEVPDGGTVRLGFTDPLEDVAFFNFESFLQPDTLYALSEAGASPQKVQSLPAFFDASGYDVVQREAESDDGTMIPYFMVGPTGFAEDGEISPTLLYGYGGFEIPILPSYSPIWGRLWMDRGGVYAIANIRGGGEFGPKWHQAALFENRPKAYEDFESVAAHMIDTGVTSSEHLGVMGGSNGGLLTGNTLVRRPDLINAAVIEVPLLDMLRYDKLPPGASWVAEYGDPDDPEQREFLREISPYHNIVPESETDYPAPLIFTSTRDDRVHPGHARKMAARLMENGHEVFYYEETEGGHGRAANPVQRAKIRAIEFAYLAQRLMDEGSGSGSPGGSD